MPWELQHSIRVTFTNYLYQISLFNYEFSSSYSPTVTTRCVCERSHLPGIYKEQINEPNKVPITFNYGRQHA